MTDEPTRSKIQLPPPRSVALDLAAGENRVPKLRAVLDWEGDDANTAHMILAPIVLAGTKSDA